MALLLLAAARAGNVSEDIFAARIQALADIRGKRLRAEIPDERWQGWQTSVMNHR